MRLRFFRLGISVFALTFGLSVVGVSLLTAGTVASSEGERMSERTLYVNDEVLPDHVLYPLLMASDRLMLEFADDHEQLYVKIEYSERRLQYAHQLLEKGDKETALSTLTKSQKYLLEVGQAVKEDNLQGGIRTRVLDELTYLDEQIEILSPQFTDEQIAVLDLLRSESKFLRDRLHTQAE